MALAPVELEQKITKLLEPRLAGDDLFLVEVKIQPGNHITVFADGDKNITLDQCADINRYLAHELNENKWAGEIFSIEVSSPGMDAPLKTLRQFKKRIGKNVEVLLKDGIKKYGKLVSANETKIGVVLFDPNKTIKGKSPVLKDEDAVEIPLEMIKNTKLSLDF